MPKTIREKIEDIKTEASGATLEEKIQPKVQAMILSLVRTNEWEEFAKIFIDESNSENVKAAQLARLTLSDELGDDYFVKQAVTYLFAESMCGGTTKTGLGNNVGNYLDIQINLKKQ